MAADGENLVAMLCFALCSVLQTYSPRPQTKNKKHQSQAKSATVLTLERVQWVQKHLSGSVPTGTFQDHCAFHHFTFTWWRGLQCAPLQHSGEEQYPTLRPARLPVGIASRRRCRQGRGVRCFATCMPEFPSRVGVKSRNASCFW